MGWDDYHFHQFIINIIYYGPPEPDLMLDLKNESRMRLEQVVLQDRRNLFKNMILVIPGIIIY